jgi:hypothetical protein
MIRTVASTIVERPMLTRNGDRPSTHALIQKHISDLPYMIECFHNAIASVSREMKWCKLALLRNSVPVEVLSLIKPFLIMKGAQDFYPSVSDNRVPRRKYLLIESKLYRMELANDTTLVPIRKYFEHLDDFKEGTQRNSWILWHLHSQYSSRTDFLKYVLYLLRGVIVIGDEYETENILRYWF